MSSSALHHVRGNSAYTQPASLGFRALSFVFDSGFAWVALCVAAIAFRASPTPGFAMPLAFLAALFGLRFALRHFTGVTLGERLWDLRAMGPKLYQCRPVRSTTLSLGTFLTLVSLIVAGWASYAVVALHPLGTASATFFWEPFLPELGTPETAQASDRFTVIPFYYSLGAWPRVFQGRDVFYNFPYEKGPPQRFAGQIQARWHMPEVRLTFEGPKTPLRAAGARESRPYPRSEIRDCITGFWKSPSSVLGCLDIRQAVLSRHLEAFRSLDLGLAQMSWIEVTNRALTPEEQVQGIYLHATGSTRGQDRFVLITARGTHQSFILDYPLGSEGETARGVFEKSIRSLRVSDDLNPGRAWINQEIQKVKLAALSAKQDQLVPKLAEVQAMLIARISVDPKDYETYFHLGGTALMLARHAARLRSTSPDPATRDLAAEWLSISRALVQSAQKYALDLAPADKRTAQLQAFWTEAQKL